MSGRLRASSSEDVSALLADARREVMALEAEVLRLSAERPAPVFVGAICYPCGRSVLSTEMYDVSPSGKMIPHQCGPKNDTDCVCGHSAESHHFVSRTGGHYACFNCRCPNYQRVADAEGEAPND